MSLLRRYTAPMPVHADDMNFIGEEMQARRNITGVDCVVDATGTHFRKPPQVGVMYPCRVQHNGGSLGSDSTDPTMTYDIYALDNTTKINTTGGPITPKGPFLFDKTTYTAGTYGHYYFDADGSYILFVYDEKPNDEACAA